MGPYVANSMGPYVAKVFDHMLPKVWKPYVAKGLPICYLDVNEQGCHVACLQVSNVANAETRSICHLPRVDHLAWANDINNVKSMIETSFPQSLVKGLECEVGVTRVVEAGDDVPGLNIIA